MSNSIVVGNHASALVLLGSDIANAVSDHVKKSIVLGKAKGAVVDALHASPAVIGRYLGKVDKKAEDAANANGWNELNEKQKVLQEIQEEELKAGQPADQAPAKMLLDTTAKINKVKHKKGGADIRKKLNQA